MTWIEYRRSEEEQAWAGLWGFGACGWNPSGSSLMPGWYGLRERVVRRHGGPVRTWAVARVGERTRTVA